MVAEALAPRRLGLCYDSRALLAITIWEYNTAGRGTATEPIAD